MSCLVLRIKEGTLTVLGGFNSLSRRVQMLGACAGAFAVIAVVMMSTYKKWDADWFGFPVILAAIPLVALPLGLGWHYNFLKPIYRTSPRILTIVVLYCILTTMAGVLLCEPPRERIYGWDQPAGVAYRYDYQYSDTYAGRTYGRWLVSFVDSFWEEDSDAGSSGDSDTDSNGSSSSDGDGTGALLVFAILAIYFVGAFIVPHFWIVSLWTGVALLAALAIKEHKLDSRRTFW